MISPVEAKVPEKHLAHETRLLPSRLPRLFRDLARLFFANVDHATLTPRMSFDYDHENGLKGCDSSSKLAARPPPSAARLGLRVDLAE